MASIILPDAAMLKGKCKLWRSKVASGESDTSEEEDQRFYIGEVKEPVMRNGLRIWMLMAQPRH